MERVLNRLQPHGLGIEVAEIVLHEADEPDTVGHLLDADTLAGEHGAEVDLAALVANAAAVGDQRSSVTKRILEIAQPLVGSGRFFV